MGEPVKDMPVFGTIASQFNDPGTNNLYKSIIDKLDTNWNDFNLLWKSSLTK